MKANGTESFERLLNLYSAHDSTILGLWRGMGIQEPESWPSFGAVFIVELHELENRYFVKVSQPLLISRASHFQPESIMSSAALISACCFFSRSEKAFNEINFLGNV